MYGFSFLFLPTEQVKTFKTIFQESFKNNEYCPRITFSKIEGKGKLKNSAKFLNGQKIYIDSIYFYYHYRLQSYVKHIPPLQTISQLLHSRLADKNYRLFYIYNFMLLFNSTLCYFYMLHYFLYTQYSYLYNQYVDLYSNLQ